MKCRVSSAEIHFALKTKQLSSLKRLLDLGADPNSIYRGATPLGFATSELDLETVTVLLKAGADPRLRSKGTNDRLEPPLVTACRLRSQRVACILLDFGADINGTDFYGHTPLWVATKEQQPELLAILLRGGAKVLQNHLYEWNWGECPLYLATKYLGSRGRHRLAKILLAAGVDPLKTDRKGRGAFYWCLRNKDYDLFSLMLDLYNPICWKVLVQSNIEDFLNGSTKELQDSFREELFNPPSLQRLCRLSLRLHLQRQTQYTNMFAAIDDLPLPAFLKSYLVTHGEIL